MKRALVVFLVTSAIGVIAVSIVARTAWRYGDTVGRDRAGAVAVEIPHGRVGAGRRRRACHRPG